MKTKHFLSVVLVSILFVVFAAILQGCGDEQKGTLLGRSSKLSDKEREEIPFLWSGEVFADVKLNNGDTVHAAINADSIEQKFLRNDLAVTVVIDGKHDNFYFVK